MTEQDDRARRERWKALGVRTDTPHPARVYDYLLGGKDNFAADREAAEMSLKISPEILDSARANRKFLTRAVGFLRDSGIRQFLDIGTGLPTSPNTYEVAQSGHPDARVVYVDNDPVVFLHAESLMADHLTTTVIRADLRDVDEVLASAGKLLDFGKPIGLLFIACLHNIPDHDDPAGIVARYLEALAPGSYLVISHATDEFAPERMHQITEEYAKRGTVFIGRGKDAILRMFNGRELVDPGIVQMSYWRPDGDQPERIASRVWGYCGVAPVGGETTVRSLKLVLIFLVVLDHRPGTDFWQGRSRNQWPDEEPHMRRIINSTYISLDGVIADPQDWPDNGIESDGTGLKAQTDLLFACDAMLMGAHTYAGMAPAWMPRSGDPFSDRFNAIAKYVVSSTLRDPEWANTTVLTGDPVAEIARLKDQPGQDIVQYGFGQLSYALLEHGLLDELRLWIHPLFVGRATSADLLFRPSTTVQFELTDTLALNTGIVILTYRVSGHA